MTRLRSEEEVHISQNKSVQSVIVIIFSYL